MKELLDHSFEEGNIPSTWVPLTVSHTYERGCLRSGQGTELKLPLPGFGWHRLRVEIELRPIQGAAVNCGVDPISATLIVKKSPYSRHSITKHSSVLADSCKLVADKPGVRQVIFEFHRGHMSAAVDGEEYIRGSDPTPVPYLGWVNIGFWYDFLVRRIRILGDEPLAKPLYAIAPQRRSDFFLDMAVDFYDDLCPGGEGTIRYSRAMYEQLFTHFERCGVRRVVWNYHDRIYADKVVIADENDIGDNFELAVEMAHKRGLEILGTIKPFETGYFARYSTPHPEFQMARKPGAWGEAQNRAIKRIDVVKEDDRPCAFSVSDLSLFVSDDNIQYRPYTGPIQREEVIEEYPVYESTASGGRPTNRARRSRVLRLHGLDIPQKYLLFSVPTRTWSFINTLVNLVHVFGENGEERRLSYGVMPMTTGAIGFGNRSADEIGEIVFDSCLVNGMPTACFAGMNAIREPFVLDFRHGLLALKCGKPQYLNSLGSPSFPEARAWWLDWVRAILGAGADGVEVRTRSHASPVAWCEFGFEQPVRDEFFKRTGVDIWKTDDFDKALWRRIRGEGYTEFCRAARAITRAAGKTLGLHIGIDTNMEPEEGACMEIHWDWRTWLHEGLADYVLLKEVWPRTRFAQEIQSHARPKGIDVVGSLYLSETTWKEPGSEKILNAWIDAVGEDGCDGYQYYECAPILRGLPEEQRVVFNNPAISDVLRRHFAGGQ